MTDIERDKLFVSLFNENKHKIMRLLRSYTMDEDLAKDLFQETMISVWNNLKTFNGKSSISTWIYRITVNTALLYKKKSKKAEDLFKRYDLETLSDTSQEDSEAYREKEELLAKLKTLIDSLNETDRIIITLYLEELNHKDIAEIVGISVNYLDVKINRIKSILEKGMKK